LTAAPLPPGDVGFEVVESEEDPVDESVEESVDEPVEESVDEESVDEEENP
jgi:hypothetical protein